MEIKKLKLRNFRNFDQLDLSFDTFTEIVRNNAWGKSNIADAIVWIFTGKLYDGSSDIESIKPKKNSKALVEVELILDNGLQLRKSYKENWTKTRGSSDYELKGHTTSYYINGLEMSQTAYEQHLSENLKIDRSTFHLLIDPTYFGLKLEWKERRQFINEIVGDITFDQITNDPIFAKNAAATSELKAALGNFGYKVDMTKKSFVQNLNKLKKDEKELEAQVAGLNLITTPIDEAAYNAYKKLDQDARLEIVRLQEGERSGSKINQLESELKSLRDQYQITNSIGFSGIKPVADQCPQCGYTLNAKEFNQKKLQYETSLTTFNEWKVKKLTEINDQGKSVRDSLAAAKSNLGGTIEGYIAKVNKLQAEITAREKEGSLYLGWKLAQDKIKEVSAKLAAVQKDINTYEMLSDLLSVYVSKMLTKLDERLQVIFGDIKFRLIEPNIKEGSWNEVCEVLDGSVPYERTNTASQIKIGIKLIQAIRKQKSYPNLPIIVDNAEAVVSRQFGTDSQIICLIAGKGN